MKEIKVKVTNDQYFSWLWLLRRRFGRDKRTRLGGLVRLAVFEVTADEARKVCEEVDEQL